MSAEGATGPAAVPRASPFGQPIGEPVPGWTARQRPPLAPMEGRLVRIVPLEPARHAPSLHAALGADARYSSRHSRATARSASPPRLASVASWRADQQSTRQRPWAGAVRASGSVASRVAGASNDSDGKSLSNANAPR